MRSGLALGALFGHPGGFKDSVDLCLPVGHQGGDVLDEHAVLALLDDRIGQFGPGRGELVAQTRIVARCPQQSGTAICAHVTHDGTPLRNFMDAHGPVLRYSLTSSSPLWYFMMEINTDREGPVAENSDLPDAVLDAGLGDAYDQIRSLRQEQDRMRDQQIAAEEQWLHRLGRAYAARKMTEIELSLAYRAYSAVAMPGFTYRWSLSTKVSLGRMQHILRDLKGEDKHAPNMPDGTWSGRWPLNGDRVPPYGTSVVYRLYDAADGECYLGSTGNLRARLKQHELDGKEFVSWTAVACADREAAFQLEDRLLAENMPYLNRQPHR